MEELLKQLNEKIAELTRKGELILQDEEVQERIENVKKQAKDLIKRYPVGSMVTGIVVGYLLAKLLTNDSDE
ncbi:MAG TPA: hypothetical protein VJ991_04565 [Balneolales bacterium]|nr:hypothetical protein [Balneolales bacterium]HYX08411.1 hypothetical protein [Bacteroidales bacterium]